MMGAQSTGQTWLIEVARRQAVEKALGVFVSGKRRSELSARGDLIHVISREKVVEEQVRAKHSVIWERRFS